MAIDKKIAPPCQHSQRENMLLQLHGWPLVCCGALTILFVAPDVMKTTIERMFSEENTAFYAAQLVLALEHLHSLGIIYRDLKPENIMLNAHGDVVLTDFGLSKVPLASEGRTNTVCGTIEYMAPEVLSERVHYDRSVDWWSLGIVIHDMLTGSPPFVANNRKKTMDAIMNKKLNLPYYLSSDAKDLLGKVDDERRDAFRYANIVIFSQHTDTCSLFCYASFNSFSSALPLPALDLDLRELRISRAIVSSARLTGSYWLSVNWSLQLSPSW